jgi:hypothetical protein
VQNEDLLLGLLNRYTPIPCPLFDHVSRLILMLGVMLLMMPSYASALAYTSCPDTQLGSFRDKPKTKTLYSNCVSNNADIATEFHWALAFEDPAIDPEAEVFINAYVPALLLPSPIAQTSVGTIPLTDVGLENMGTGYTGDCTEATAATTRLALVDSNYYCGWATTTSGAKVLLKAEVNKGEINDFSIKQNAVVIPQAVPMWRTPHLAALALLLPLLYGLVKFRDR